MFVTIQPYAGSAKLSVTYGSPPQTDDIGDTVSYAPDMGQWHEIHIEAYGSRVRVWARPFRNCQYCGPLESSFWSLLLDETDERLALSEDCEEFALRTVLAEGTAHWQWYLDSITLNSIVMPVSGEGEGECEGEGEGEP
jgi:hypothetical protein